jgi:hypothetical protein
VPHTRLSALSGTGCQRFRTTVSDAARQASLMPRLRLLRVLPGGCGRRESRLNFHGTYLGYSPYGNFGGTCVRRVCSDGFPVATGLHSRLLRGRQVVPTDHTAPQTLSGDWRRLRYLSLVIDTGGARAPNHAQSLVSHHGAWVSVVTATGASAVRLQGVMAEGLLMTEAQGSLQ